MTMLIISLISLAFCICTLFAVFLVCFSILKLMTLWRIIGKIIRTAITGTYNFSLRLIFCVLFVPRLVFLVNVKYCVSLCVYMCALYTIRGSCSQRHGSTSSWLTAAAVSADSEKSALTLRSRGKDGRVTWYLQSTQNVNPRSAHRVEAPSWTPSPYVAMYPGSRSPAS